jgi:hypothetical protein
VSRPPPNGRNQALAGIRPSDLIAVRGGEAHAGPENRTWKYRKFKYRAPKLRARIDPARIDPARINPARIDPDPTFPDERFRGARFRNGELTGAVIEMPLVIASPAPSIRRTRIQPQLHPDSASFPNGQARPPVGLHGEQKGRALVNHGSS